ncbi:hypothetical protein CRX72_22330 [Pantoea sp. BRM17]|nr:hypothetical protein CRX72_22330 [Pantoea sp. BRM17]
MGNLYKCSSNKKIITPREFEALKTTLLTKTRKLDWSCSIKTFYSQRHSALKKLNNSELYLQERFLFHFSKASVFLLNKASLKDFICFCEENERADEIILLLVSRDMMPLAISLAYRSSKINYSNFRYL